MSLINRMLRDLSSRQPPAGNVMTGIQVSQDAAPRGNAVVRLGMLAVLVVAFTGVLWLVFGPKAMKVPQVREIPVDAAIVADAPAPGESPPPEQPAEHAEAAAPVSEPPAKPETAPAEPPAAPPARASRPVKARPVASTPTKTPAAPPTLSAEELYARARRALERGDDAAAEAGLVEALAAKPSLHYAREDLGNLRIRQGRLDDAESTLRAGLEQDSSWVGYRRLAARVDLARDRPAAAIEVLLRDPPPVERDVDYHALLASAYQRLGRHEEASRGYRELARVQPDEASWWAGYGLSRDALDDAAGALTAYARARQLGGLDPRVLQHINQRTAALQAAG